VENSELFLADSFSWKMLKNE